MYHLQGSLIVDISTITLIVPMITGHSDCGHELRVTLIYVLSNFRFSCEYEQYRCVSALEITVKNVKW
jgi:hypothetical protein